MISTHYRNNIYTIWKSFFFAIILQILPCPLQIFNLPQPSWLHLLLIYWATKSPNHINIGTGFAIGLITDIFLGPILGIHAINISIIIYFLITRFPLFHNMLLWKQCYIVILLSFNIHLIPYVTNMLLITKIEFYLEIFLNSTLDGIIWIGIFIIMQKLSTHNKIKKQTLTIYN